MHFMLIQTLESICISTFEARSCYVFNDQHREMDCLAGPIECIKRDIHLGVYHVFIASIQTILKGDRRDIDAKGNIRGDTQAFKYVISLDAL